MYIFQDGKMGKQNRYGRAIYLKKGESLETVDGNKIIISSKDVARLGESSTKVAQTKF